ncbi:RsiV family protein [Paenibacillus gansuensis]|uniref:RsiV family protein n=1 Tax=Paenibacillus gansuensis TaxID=306542 RepID=A0ABW5PH60_9BACL
MPNYEFPVQTETRTLQAPGGVYHYPALTGLKSTSVQVQINNQIRQLAQQLLRYQQQYLSGSNPESIGNYEIKTNERAIFSHILSSYAYSSPMAHGNTLAKSQTFNVRTGRKYSLGDLFKPGSAYTAKLSAIVSAQIKQRDIQLLGNFPGVAPDQDYYLADKSLVVYYQLYAITPYYYGLPMFPISVYDLQNEAAEGGPLDILSQQLA